MRYLFFDIGAADGFHGLCEFGVVITDENFNVSYEKLYLMNPQTRFNVTGRPDRPDVILHFSKEQYENSPTFRDMFDNIKFVLSQKDVMISRILEGFVRDINCRPLTSWLMTFRRCFHSFRRKGNNMHRLEKWLKHTM